MELLYFVDGLKYNLINDNMPFLATLNKKRLKSEFGYSCVCHATMYTGRYPEEHNTWFVWKRGKNSPYKFVNLIPLLKYINILPMKVILSKVARKLNRNTSFAGIPMLVNLPLKYWGEFEPCEDVHWTDDKYLANIETIFKIIKKSRLKYKLVGLDKKNGFIEKAQETAIDSDKNFYYFFIGELDDYLHKYGDKSDNVKGLLKRIDNMIKRHYEQARKITPDLTLICYSDHGHINVTEKIDINEYFQQKNKNVNVYLNLIESTFARFWVKTAQERKDVLECLDLLVDKGWGFVLTKEHFDKYHLNFDNNEHGDIIFHLNAPRIFTNTIWGFGKTIRSMHGYVPELDDHAGVLLSNKKIKDVASVSLVDILPTVLKAAGCKNEDGSLVGTVLIE